MKLAILSAAATLAIFATTANAAVNLVTNPGFETGDFNGWSVGPIVSIDNLAANVNSGTYSAKLANIIEPRGIDQDIATIIGHNYKIEFYLKTTSGQFSAYFGTAALLNINPSPAPYAYYSFTVPATAATTNLNFAGWAFSSQFSLDDISVTDLDAAPVPEPASLSLLAIGALALLSRKRSCRQFKF